MLFIIVNVLVGAIFIPSLKFVASPSVSVVPNVNVAFSFMYRPATTVSLIVALPLSNTLLSIKHSYPFTVVAASPLLYIPPAPMFPPLLVQDVFPTPFVANTCV